MNQYVTTRTTAYSNFWVNVMNYEVNVMNYDGSLNVIGKHPYSHKRSARRAAIALAKKLDVSYRQDLEYNDTPHAFIALTADAVKATR